MSLLSKLNNLIIVIGQDMKSKANKINWFTLVSGYELIEDLPSIASGEVIKYTYSGGLIRYRFIAFDDSEDSFYMEYSNGNFSNLVATKKL